MKQNVFVRMILFTSLCLVGLLYLALLLGSIYEAVVFPPSPEKVTLAQAVQMASENKPTFWIFGKSLYISITDPIWECASIEQVERHSRFGDESFTNAVFTDSKKTAVVFVQVDGLYNCQELKAAKIAGELQHFIRRPVDYQSDINGLITIDEASEIITLSLCTHCTPSEARLYPVFFLLFPFAMWLIFEFGKRQQKRNVGL